MSLTADEILNVSDIPEPTRVSVPEWGGDGHVYVKVMGGDERDEYEMTRVKKVRKEYENDFSSQTAKLLACCLCDEGGDRLFSQAQMKDLAKKNGVVLERLEKIASEINRLGIAGVKDAEKNLPAAQSGNSGSD